jgi:carbon storage regulator
MLVLTRKSQQEIVIAGGIRITILDVGKGRVKIGIAAPDDVRILRGEIPSTFVEEEPVPGLLWEGCA